MRCPACARPVAMAKSTCVYCGASLPAEVLAEAAQAAERVLRSRNLNSLEAAAAAAPRDAQKRRYLVVDTSASPVESLAQACSISLWEAKQWQAASRYRLVRISSEPADGPTESALKEKGLKLWIIPEEMVERGRKPVLVGSIDLGSGGVRCLVRHDPEQPPATRPLPEQDLALIVSGLVKRERVKEQASLRNQPGNRLEDAWVIHLHLVGEGRPWEIDPRYTSYENAGPASAHINTLELIRRLAASVPHDESFRTIVPAMAPSMEPPPQIAAGASAPKSAGKQTKAVILDNLAQFHEFSSWRGAVEVAQRTPR